MTSKRGMFYSPSDSLTGSVLIQQGSSKIEVLKKGPVLVSISLALAMNDVHNMAPSDDLRGQASWYGRTDFFKYCSPQTIKGFKGQDKSLL